MCAGTVTVSVCALSDVRVNDWATWSRLYDTVSLCGLLYAVGSVPYFGLSTHTLCHTQSHITNPFVPIFFSMCVVQAEQSHI
jgi:hypothetical protein